MTEKNIVFENLILRHSGIFEIRVVEQTIVEFFKKHQYNPHNIKQNVSLEKTYKNHTLTIEAARAYPKTVDSNQVTTTIKFMKVKPCLVDGTTGQEYAQKGDIEVSFFAVTKGERALANAHTPFRYFVFSMFNVPASRFFLKTFLQKFFGRENKDPAVELKQTVKELYDELFMLFQVKEYTEHAR
ncbi:MAG: hypothetical protein ACI8Y7_000649 [Candidatus Woesearchaeota archaeon]|jgi:hypothetical protein